MLMPELCRGFKVTFKVYDALLLLGIAVYTLAFFAVTWRLTYIFKHFRMTKFCFCLIILSTRRHSMGYKCLQPWLKICQN